MLDVDLLRHRLALEHVQRDRDHVVGVVLREVGDAAEEAGRRRVARLGRRNADVVAAEADRVAVAAVLRERLGMPAARASSIEVAA